MDQKLIFRFFKEFSTFEHALKRSGFLKADRYGNAQPNWTEFREKMRGRFSEVMAGDFQEAVGKLIRLAPKRQIVKEGESLGWAPVAHKVDDSHETYAIQLLRVVRNNLFHGGKYPDGPIEELARNREILQVGITILKGLVELNPEMKKWLVEEKNIDTQVEPLEEQVFLGEIAFQARIALLSSEQLFSTHLHPDPYEVWRSIQSFLVAAANISKILWPSNKIYESRGKHLRSMLLITQDNRLSDRKIRNHFEHYDERIEEWFEKPSSAGYLAWAFEDRPSPWGKLDPRHRVYNPVTGTLTFRGESIELAALAMEIKEIQLKCSRFTLI